MSFNKPVNMIYRIKSIINALVFGKFRIIKYSLISSCYKVYGSPKKNCPVLMNGLGSIYFGKNVHLGYQDSPFFFNTYIYLEARNINSRIELGAGVYLNNNACIISEGNEGIIIGPNTLTGTNLTIYDSDFHDLDPSKRLNGTPKTAGVKIGENVFIGSNVTILKGVKIGDNSIIGNGAVVTKSVPSNVIAAGNPCIVIKSLLQ